MLNFHQLFQYTLYLLNADFVGIVELYEFDDDFVITEHLREWAFMDRMFFVKVELLFQL